ncbi:uncharacterized protein LOC111129947 isoform X3 [Crassostrea virginica]
MDTHDGIKEPCQKCGENHETLRLSLRKRTKKCFSRSKKRLEDAVGSSSENWLHNATIQRLQAKEKQEEDRNLFLSPMSHCSSQLTPDILKYHRGRTYESSPEISTFERLLSSQSSTATPHNDWLHPSLGSSPEGRTVPQTSEEAIIRSLGITAADDSGISWTSSLATPSHLPPPTGTDDRQDLDEDGMVDKGKSKGVPRALFSPGVTRNQEELCRRLNDSDIEFKAESNIDTRNNVKTKEFSERPDVLEMESMPLFSQELIQEEVAGDVNMKKGKSPCSKKENLESVKESNAVIIKQEVIDETLSDFFDPPSKSVGKRRCAPSKGRKRKSLGDSPLGKDFAIKKEAEASILSSTPLEKKHKLQKTKSKSETPVEKNKSVFSILSNEKSKGSRSSKRKRVTFNNSDHIFKEIVTGKRNYDVKFSSEVEEDLTNQEVKRQDVEENVFKKEVIPLEQTTEENAVVIEDQDDLFSQVSPSSLKEMCSIDNQVLFSIDENVNKSSSNPKIIGNQEKITESVETEKMSDQDKSTSLKINAEEQTGKDGTFKSEEDATTVAPKIPVLMSRGRKFLYPTTNQISKSCPKVLYGFKEAEVTLHNQKTPDENLAVGKQENATTTGQSEEKRTVETKCSKFNPATGFQRFSKLQISDEGPLTDELTSKYSVREKCLAVEKATPVKHSSALSTDKPQTCQTLPDVSNGHISEQKAAQNLVTLKPLSLEDTGDNHPPPSTSTSLIPPTQSLEGFSTAGGRKLVMNKEALLKARSLLESEGDDLNEKGEKRTELQGQNLEKTDNRSNLVKLPSTGSEMALDKSNIGVSAVCDGAFHGFQTASGRKVALSESSIKKAQLMISEEGDITAIPPTKLDSADVVPSGDRESIAKGNKKQMVGFSGMSKQPSLGGKLSMTSVSSNNKENNSVKKIGKNIFSDIFEEFQDCSSIGGDKFSGFKTAGGEGFNTTRSSKKINYPAEKKTYLEVLDKENPMECTEEEIIKSMFSGMKNKGGKNPESEAPGPSSVIKPVSAAPPMKSASTSARFPPGSNIPKGFRPFKPPKIVPKAKPKEPTSKVSDVGKISGASESVVSLLSEPNSVSLLSEPNSKNTEQIKQRVCPVSIENSDEGKKVNTNFPKKENEQSEESADLSNLFLNDMFDEEMEISQKLHPESADVRKLTEKTMNGCGVSDEMEGKAESFVEQGKEIADSEKLQNKDLCMETSGVQQRGYGGFHTASGKSVVVDESSLKKAKELWETHTVIHDDFDVVDIDPEVMFKDMDALNMSKSSINQTKILNKNSLKNGKSSCEESQTLKTNVNENGFACSSDALSKFQTASGKCVKIEESSLLVTTEMWTKTMRDDNLKVNNESDELTKDDIKNVIQDSQSLMEKIPEVEHCEKIDDHLVEDKTLGFGGFQTASNKNVSISEKALLKGEEVWKNSSMDDSLPSTSATYDRTGEKSNPMKFNGFQTASGKTVSISEKAFLEGKKLWINSSMDNTIPTTSSTDDDKEKKSNFNGFQSASGKTVRVSENALLECKKLWINSSKDDIYPSTSGMNDKEMEKSDPMKFNGFQTASGKSVSVSEKALLEGKKLWINSSTDDICPSTSGMNDNEVEKSDPMKFNGFQTASGKSVTVNEKALLEGKKLWINSFTDDTLPITSAMIDKEVEKSNPMKFSGFQTASGKMVEVDDKSVTEARKLWNSAEEKCDSLPHSVLEDLFEPDNFSSQTSTNDKMVTVNLEENTKGTEKNQIVPKVSDLGNKKSPTVSCKTEREANGMWNPGPSATVSPFLSASGKSIQVSEKALNHVKSESVEKGEGKENENPICLVNQSEPNMEVSNSMSCPFMSASGRQISVSASALESTKALFEDKEENNFLIMAEKKSFSPFQSASGKSVSVSQKSLQVAQAFLEDSNEMETLHNRTKTNEDAHTEPGLKETSFSHNKNSIGSVSQKTVGMNGVKLEESDKLTKQTLTFKAANMDSNESGISPFQSASGKSVSISQKSLEKARAQLLENLDSNVDIPQTSDVDMSPPETVKQGFSVKSNASHQKRKLDDIRTPKKQTGRQVGDAKEYENLILPDDFFDEMETPNKKFKMAADAAPSNKLSGRKVSVSDRKNFTALSTVPEGYTKDRQSFYAKPLKCQSIGDLKNSSNTLLKYEEPKKMNIPSTVIPSSSFKTPYKAGAPVTDSKPKSSVKSVQPVFVPKTKPLGQSQEKSGNMQIDGGSSVSSPSSSRLQQTATLTVSSIPDITTKTSTLDKAEYTKALETNRARQEDIIKSKSSCRVKPSAGRLFQLKTSGARIKLREIIKGQQSKTNSTHVGSSAVSVRSSNAAKHQFYLPDFYGSGIAHVYVGDGALLVPDNEGCTGSKELYKAFLTIDSIDPSLISEAWFCNHYRWIVWKLASYEVVSPDKFGIRSLTPENVMLQMKYRYDREIDRCQRSALRKIMERDDAPSKRLVLCVSSIHRSSSANPTVPSSKQADPEAEVRVELTDGWYCIPAKLDLPFLSLINRRRLQTGSKLCTSGAELVGSQDPSSPLEAPASLQLKIHTNSTRPVPGDAVLGFQSDPRPLCVPLSDLEGEGGLVGSIEVVLGRKYPLMYMEKLPDGGSVFRTAQAEEKFNQLHQKQREDAMETLYRKLEKEFDKEDYEESCAVKRQWSESEIEDLQSGQEVWEAIRTAKRPDIVEGYLSDAQVRSLMEYKQQLHQEKLQRLQNEFQKSWSEEQENSKNRNVVPLLKLRVIGLCRKDVDSKASTIISVWRPGQEVLDLTEGRRYRVFSLSASHTRSKFGSHSVQLTATRQIKFLPVKVNENLLDLVYEPREVLCACDLKRRQPMFGELDIVCFLVSIKTTDINESPRNQEIVYGMDRNGDILGIKFWGGLKAFGLNSTLTVGSLFCGSNLLDKFPYRSSFLPIIEASMEFSVFTKSPQGASQRKAHQVLTDRIKTAGEKTLVERGQQLVSELLERKQSLTLGHTPTKTDSGESMGESTTPVPPCTVHQAKMARLMSYGSPSPLSPIPTKVTPAARKNYKVPKPADL